MQQDQPGPAAEPRSRSTLLAASVDRADTLELVEYEDGSLGISLNDEAIEGCHWQSEHADDGIQTYLRMIRSE